MSVELKFISGGPGVGNTGRFVDRTERQVGNSMGNRETSDYLPSTRKLNLMRGGATQRQNGGPPVVNSHAYEGPIPRIRRLGTNKSTSRRFDTFGETALETIYDEFRFLDEPDAPSPASSGVAILQDRDQKPQSCLSSFSCLFCVLPFIQMIFSSSLFILAIIRFQQLSTDTSGHLLSLVNPIGNDPTDPKALNILRLQSATSLILPSFIQTVASIFGFWPCVRNNKRIFQILHIAFCMLSILFWFPSIDNISIEINIYSNQTITEPNNVDSILFVILLALGYFVALVLPSVTLIISSFKLFLQRRHCKSLIATTFAIGTALIAATVVCFAAFATSKSLSLLTLPTSRSDLSVFYGFGLRELSISIQICLFSIFYFFAAVNRDSGLTLASILLQWTNLLAIGIYILSPPRVTSLLQNIQILQNEKISIGYANVIMLYSFILLLFLLLLILFISTVFSIRKSEKNSEIPSNSDQRTSF